jgi:hypothetical protein
MSCLLLPCTLGTRCRPILRLLFFVISGSYLVLSHSIELTYCVSICLIVDTPAPPKVSNPTDCSVTITWEKVLGAQGYRVYGKSSSSLTLLMMRNAEGQIGGHD